MSLMDERCVPCRGGVEPLTRAESESLLASLPGWSLDADARRISKTYRFGNFREAAGFAQRVGAIAEAEGHHPDIGLGWGYCSVSLRTHKIRGLHRNDFIVAARTEAAASGADAAGLVSATFESYVDAPADAVWDALVNPDITPRYWQHVNVSDWRVGSRWEHRDAERGGMLDLVGIVLEAAWPNRLVLSWAFPDDETRPEKHSRVAFDIAPDAGVTRLAVTHDRLEPGSDMLAGITKGWPKVLSSLKTLLETGHPLPRLWTRKAA
jgi:pterin-4a-carbinolamine dehydratase/uncharacterized protein YndB with AHSA1/START domain